MAIINDQRGEINQAFTPSGLKDQAHASLVAAFVSWLRRKPGVWTFCEVFFNHFGDRGVIDCVALFQPYPAGPWRGIVCEMKPRIVDLGETIRQVKKAEIYFQLPPTMANFGQPILRFLLVLEATESNYITATQYANLLDDLEVHFFSRETALQNPFEQAWHQRPNQATERHEMWQPSIDRNSFVFEDQFRPSL